MDEPPVKIAKITMHVDYMDGSAIEAQAVEPHDMAVDVAYPAPEIDLSYHSPIIALQPPPTVTVRFTVSRDHGWHDRYISRAEMEDHADTEAAVIKRTVAATLRQVATWIGVHDNDEAALYDMAAEVDAFDDEACCPCCQEVTCDEGCPLAPVRRHAEHKES